MTDPEPTWNVPHASTIRCLYAAIDRIRAGDEPAEIFRDFGWQFDADAQTDAAPKLDANPPQRKPLTDEQIEAGWRDECPRASLDAFTDGVVFAERWHGIGGKDAAHA